MAALRFRFGLTPLEDVAGWGDAGDRMHWFGLTDGWYRIEAGEDVVPPGDIDYYVARLWADVVRWAAAVLEPLPGGLVPLLRDVREGRLPARLRIDVDHLVKEHDARTRTLALALDRPWTTDWDAVRRAGRRMLAD